MGLDVYLYRYVDRDATRALEADYQRRADDIWNAIPGRAGRTYEQLTDQERDAARQATETLAAEMGLDKYGEPPASMRAEINLPSTTYPEHLFKIGYLRSSYNDGGINHILRNALGKDLYWVFDVDDNHDYVITPDWGLSLQRANQVRNEWVEHSDVNPYRVRRIGFNQFKDPLASDVDSEHAALQAFLKERDTYTAKHSNESMYWYSGHGGEFFFGNQPLIVRAIIEGTEHVFSKEQRVPCFYAICEDETTNQDWYTQALTITIEMIEWVLNQSDTELYSLHWSS